METTTTQPMGLNDEPEVAREASDWQGGADAAQAPAWAQAQCLLDAAHSIDAARGFVAHVNLAAAVDALASACESLVNAMQVQQ